MSLFSLKKIELFSDLSESDLTQLSSVVKYSRFAKNEFVLMKGDISDSLIFLVSGELHVVDYTLEGQTIWLSSLKSGQHFGELGLILDKPRTASLIAVKESLVGLINRKAAIDLMTNNASIAWKIMKRLAHMIELSNDQLMLVNLPDVRSRVIAVLSRYQSTVNDELFLEGLPTQQRIAVISNTTRETVTRVISSLVKEGCLEKEKKRYKVLNPSVFSTNSNA